MKTFAAIWQCKEKARMQNEVAVTGLGIISPIGNSIDEFWKNCVNGATGIGPITHFDASRLESRIAAEVKNFDPSKGYAFTTCLKGYVLQHYNRL